MFLPKRFIFVYRNLPGIFTFLISATALVNSQPAQDQGVCASLYITNKNRPENELSGRNGCRYVLQNVILKEVNYVDVAAINEKLSTIFSIDGLLIIDSVSYSGSAANVSTATIRFPQLAVIRGNEAKTKSPVLPVLISNTNYYPSLLIRLFQISGKPVSVALPALRVVVQGDIVVVASLQFIFAKNINWNSFLTGEDNTQRVVVGATSYPGVCSNLCSKNFSYCFGPEVGDCQLQAAGSYGCDSQCLGGCTGPSSSSKCLACRKVTDIASSPPNCLNACPPPTDNMGRPQADGRFTLGDTLCVKQCPPGLVRFASSCMLRCPNSDGLFTYEKNGECLPCLSSKDAPCVEAEGECYPEKMNVSNGFIMESNAAAFVNCTKIYGDVVIYLNFVSQNAVRSLSNITSVVGVVKVRRTAFTDLDFLSKLQTIENRWQVDTNTEGAGSDAALFIENNVVLDRLSLRSLQSVRGRITIVNNPKLCVPPAEVLRSQFLQSGQNGSFVVRLSGNKDLSSQDCACSPKCKRSPAPAFTSQSCLAPNDPSQCVACDAFKDASSRLCLSSDECAPPKNRYISSQSDKLCSSCHEECVGCSGPTAKDCSTCKTLRRTSTGECVSTCGDAEYLNIETNSCEQCHEGCTSGCFGPGNLLCSSRNAVQTPSVGCKPGCRLVLFSRENVSFYCQADNCPNGYYRSANFTVPELNTDVISPGACFAKAGRAAAVPTLEKTSFCLPCSRNCFQCTSPDMCTQCMPGTFKQISNSMDYQLIRDSSQQSKRFGFSFTCVTQCTGGYYGAGGDNEAGQCEPCDDSCATCAGGAVNCTKCRYRVLEIPPASKSSTPAPGKWRCVSHCPSFKPIVRPLCRNDTETSTVQGPCVYQGDYTNSSIPPTLLGECFAAEAQRNIPAIVGGTVAAGLVVIIVIVVLIVVCQLRRRARDNKQTALVMQQLEPTLEPQDGATRVDSMASSFFGSSKPDMANLRLIAESALKRGKVLGRGAFGTVFAGTWQPETGVRVPVALKVLRRRGPAGFTMAAESPVGPGQTILATSESSSAKDRNSGTSNSRAPSAGTNIIDDVINEARIMCSVSHPCCVRVVGLCLGQEDVVLVTQLMQLGSLLDLLLKEKDVENRRFGAWHLLTWAQQIADGMAYLESRGIIHRDLAARNVLVRNLTQVRITDFGLAKLLEGQQRVYRPMQGGGGERLPFKWLALESLRLRVFTHKSDVWSYGVTLWEIFTFGEAPYGSGIMPDRLIALLEDGNRLPQPVVASIDVYTPMIKCWVSDPEERPSFADLSEQFKTMATDPGRYLAIKGDTHCREPNAAPIQPPSPNELLADLGVSNQTYNEQGASAGFSGDAAGQVGRSLKTPEGQLSKVVDVDEYLPSEFPAARADGQQPRRSRLNHPSFNNSGSPLRVRHHPSAVANMTPTQRLAWRNNGYTIDPTSQRSSSNSNVDGGVDTRNVLRIPSGIAQQQAPFPGPLPASVHIDSAIAEDYLMPSNSSPTTAPLLSPPPIASPAANSYYDGQRTSQIPLWRSSGQPPVSPSSSHRETVI